MAGNRNVKVNFWSSLRATEVDGPRSYGMSPSVALTTTVNWRHGASREICRMKWQVMSMSVCLTVCLSASIYPELHVKLASPIVSCQLPVAVARSSSGGVVIRWRRYVVLVSRMTSYLHVMDHTEACRYHCCRGLWLQPVTSLRRHAQVNVPAAAYWLRPVSQTTAALAPRLWTSAGREACNAPLVFSWIVSVLALFVCWCCVIGLCCL